MKIKMIVELEIDESLYETPEEKQWVRCEVLMNTDEGEGMYLHSNYLGDELGPIKVIEILEVAE